MQVESLRSEVEAVYNIYVKALKNRDADAFASVVDISEEEKEDFLAEFNEAAEFFLMSTPDLSQTNFLTVKTMGDDLAGYYCTWTDTDDPEGVNIFLARFQRVEGSWKVLPGDSTYRFQPEAGEDIKTRAMELIESEPELSLTPPMDEERAIGDYNTDLWASLECMAYDYEVSITINGVPLDYQGGDSFGHRLFGVATGAEPSMPGVLRLGENRVEMNFRKTDPSSEFPLRLEVFLPAAGCCCRMVAAKRPSGNMSATFEISRSPTDEISPEEIQVVEVTDDD